MPVLVRSPAARCIRVLLSVIATVLRPLMQLRIGSFVGNAEPAPVTGILVIKIIQVLVFRDRRRDVESRGYRKTAAEPITELEAAAPALQRFDTGVAGNFVVQLAVAVVGG